MSTLSRRTLMKLLATTSALASVGSTFGCATDEGADGSGNALETTEFDFIVIGSGAGGGPVACRLAEAGFTVCIVEAGGNAGEKTVYQVPAFHGQSTEEPSMQWDFFVEHWEDKTQAAKDPKRYEISKDQNKSRVELIGENPKNRKQREGILYPRAGTLGGCTSHNAMITIRPQDADWEDIKALTNDKSWSAANMKKYFTRLESCSYSSDAIHGKKGWLATSLPKTADLLDFAHFKPSTDVTIANILYRAAAAIGSITPPESAGASLTRLLGRDLNFDEDARDTAEGLFTIPVAVGGDTKVPEKLGLRNGTRERILATRDANPDKLTLLLNTFVQKIVFEGTKAVGVEAVKYEPGEAYYRASPLAKDEMTANKLPLLKARKEIIVAAGAFNTPQILMLSGVGPKGHLAEMGIDVVADLPGVGGNLQDRYEVCVVGDQPEGKDFELFTTKDGKKESCTYDITGAKNPPDPCLVEWKATHAGPYVGNKCVGGIVLRSDSAKTTKGPSDVVVFGLQSGFYGYFPGDTKGEQPQGNQAGGRWSAIEPPPGKNPRARFAWAVLKGHTENRAGYVRLRSSDPRDTPVINFKYFEEGTNDDGQAERDLDAVVQGVKLARRIMTDAGLKAAGPMANVADSKLTDFVRDNAWGHHASCTCPIGTVLDKDFRVKGTTGLRVVDASIFPKIPGLFIVTAIYMASEKAADVIALEYGKEVRA
jgi:choline dehydrogenase